ncbi:SUMO ligase siz1, partial [Mortierella sp. GBA43]
MVFSCWADATTPPMLMEFPHVCEIKVNGRVLEANLRGMKNKPGTVAPANITRLFRSETADHNKIEFVYANSSKKYYVSVHLVRRHSVESVVSGVESGKFLSKEKMIQMLEDRNRDDDIVATSSTLSLKCPVNAMYNLQVMMLEALADTLLPSSLYTGPGGTHRYFQDILSKTPSHLESITVQADGSWELPSAHSSVPVPSSPKKKATVPKGDSVFVIDEDDGDDDMDDDDDDEVKATTPPASSKPAKPSVEVIDLISDSEDDETEVVSPPTGDTDGDMEMGNPAVLQADSGAQTSVKTESFDKPTPTESGVAPVPAEARGMMRSTDGSPGSEASPVMRTRMVQGEAIHGGPLSPESRIAPAWEVGEDAFAHTLLTQGRKRQYD